MREDENKRIALSEAAIGTPCVVESVNCTGAALRRFLDLGLAPGTRVTPLFVSPAKNPVAYLVRGSVIALRREDCKHIMVDL